MREDVGVVSEITNCSNFYFLITLEEWLGSEDGQLRKSITQVPYFGLIVPGNYLDREVTIVTDIKWPILRRRIFSQIIHCEDEQEDSIEIPLRERDRRVKAYNELSLGHLSMRYWVA